MDFDDLITERVPPPKRQAKTDGEHEDHFYEGAVMVAYAMHLLRTEPIDQVRIHPDGEHGKQFDFAGWLARQGFRIASGIGSTTYGGTYRDGAGRTIVVNPKAGVGDVVADGVSAECKGGIINTRHSGQVSRLDKGLCEVVGRLMASETAGRQVAVIPYTEATLRLAKRLAPRCARAGIEIALVGRRGEVIAVRPDGNDEPRP